MSATRNPPRTRIRSMSASARLVLTRRGGHTHRYRRARPAHGFFRPAFDGFGQLLHRAMRFPGLPSDTPRLSTVRSLATVMAENPCGSGVGAVSATVVQDVPSQRMRRGARCAAPTTQTSRLVTTPTPLSVPTPASTVVQYLPSHRSTSVRPAPPTPSAGVSRSERRSAHTSHSPVDESAVIGHAPSGVCSSVQPLPFQDSTAAPSSLVSSPRPPRR
jgi:hypothetical protein